MQILKGRRFLTVLVRVEQKTNKHEFGCCSRSCVRSTGRLCGVLFLCSSRNQININDCFKKHICTFLLCCTCLWLVVDAWVCFSLLCFIAHPLTRALRRVQFLRDLGNSKGANKERNKVTHPPANLTACQGTAFEGSTAQRRL